MVEEEKDCTDVLTQMAAARAALSAAASQVLTNYTFVCMEKERQTGQNSYESLTRAFALWASGASDGWPASAAEAKVQRRGQRGKVKKA